MGKKDGEGIMRVRPWVMTDTLRLVSSPGLITYFETARGSGTDPWTGTGTKRKGATNLLDPNSPAKNGEAFLFFGISVKAMHLVTGTTAFTGGAGGVAIAPVPTDTFLAGIDNDFLCHNEAATLTFKVGTDHTFQELMLRDIPCGNSQRFVGSNGSLTENYMPWPSGALMMIRENITLRVEMETNTNGTAFPSGVPLITQLNMHGLRLMNINDIGEEEMETVIRQAIANMNQPGKAA